MLKIGTDFGTTTLSVILSYTPTDGVRTWQSNDGFRTLFQQIHTMSAWDDHTPSPGDHITYDIW